MKQFSIRPSRPAVQRAKDRFRAETWARQSRLSAGAALGRALAVARSAASAGPRPSPLEVVQLIDRLKGGDLGLDPAKLSDAAAARLAGLLPLRQWMKLCRAIALARANPFSCRVPPDAGRPAAANAGDGAELPHRLPSSTARRPDRARHLRTTTPDDSDGW